MRATNIENVYILDDHFYFPSLNRTRRIWVYLPNGYEATDVRYPVIYMHDGQNLFDEANAFGTEWEIDETLDRHHGKIIVIGIENGEAHRMAEYMMHDHPEHGPGEGSLYLSDITEVLKPYVDKLLRTRPEKAYTCIAGSSMGGLISLYAGLYFSHVFGIVGVFSAAIWLDAPGIFVEAQTLLNRLHADGGNTNSQRWYFYAGAMESETMAAEVATMVKLFREYPQLDVTYQIDAAGIHDEALWKNYFPEFYKWMTGKKSAATLEWESDVKLDT